MTVKELNELKQLQLKFLEGIKEDLNNSDLSSIMLNQEYIKDNEREEKEMCHV